MADTAQRGPGRPRDLARRQTVIDAATRVFTEHGYAGTSLARVAAAASISKSAVLHHCESKEALYFAVLEGVVSDLGGFIAQARVMEGPFVDRLDRLGRTIVDYLGTNPGAAKLLISELIGRGPYARGPGAATVNRTMQIVVAFLSAGMSAGELRSQDPVQLAMSIAGMHLTYFAAHEVTATLAGEDPFSDAMLARRREAIVEGVRALCLP